MDSVRKPLQGVCNIIRFNWHYYVLSIIFVLSALMMRSQLNNTNRFVVDALALLLTGSTFISLLVSAYVYDFSCLYTLSWLSHLKPEKSLHIINVNAGFDETSHLLQQRFPNADLLAIDFYDPQKHTEVSIERARKALPPYPSTQTVSTSDLAIATGSADLIFCVLSAHEIRNIEERIVFFKALNRVLKDSGEIIVTEHLRDTANFLAYNIGHFHFHSKGIWLKTFSSAGLQVKDIIKITPFITTFILTKDGTAL